MTFIATELAHLWIGRQCHDTSDRRESINPATGEVTGERAVGGEQDAEQAVAAAKRAFTTSAWRSDRSLRARVLNAMADVFDRRLEEFVDVIATENGKITSEARFEASTHSSPVTTNPPRTVRSRSIDAGNRR